MNRKRLTAILALPSLIISLFTGQSQADSQELTIGDLAPSFKLIDQHNTTHELKHYKNKWLILYFYPKDDTPGCTKEACHFRDDIIQIKRLNASVLGVSLDDTVSHEKFAKKFNLSFSLLADTDGRTSKAYGSLFSILGIRFAKRHSFIIDPDGHIAKIYRDVDADTHSQTIINDLTQLIKHTKP